MSPQPMVTSGTAEMYYILKAYHKTEPAIWDIEAKKVQIINEKGQIESLNFNADLKFLYMLLTKFINWNDEYGNKVKYSREHIARKTGWGLSKVTKNLALLEKTGLIQTKNILGETNEYIIHSLRTSHILYDRKDENGNYVHKEIKHYIDRVNGMENELLDNISPFFYTILDTFGKRKEELSQGDIKGLNEIINDGGFKKSNLLENAESFAEHKKNVSDFIQFMRDEQERKKRQTSVPLYDWTKTNSEAAQ